MKTGPYPSAYRRYSHPYDTSPQRVPRPGFQRPGETPSQRRARQERATKRRQKIERRDRELQRRRSGGRYPRGGNAFARGMARKLMGHFLKRALGPLGLALLLWELYDQLNQPDDFPGQPMKDQLERPKHYIFMGYISGDHCNLGGVCQGWRGKNAAATPGLGNCTGANSTKSGACSGGGGLSRWQPLADYTAGYWDKMVRTEHGTVTVGAINEYWQRAQPSLSEYESAYGTGFPFNEPYRRVMAPPEIPEMPSETPDGIMDDEWQIPPREFEFPDSPVVPATRAIPDYYPYVWPMSIPVHGVPLPIPLPLPFRHRSTTRPAEQMETPEQTQRGNSLPGARETRSKRRQRPRRPPKKREKEQKIVSGLPPGAFSRFVNFLTEAHDFVHCMYKALPKHRQRAHTAQGRAQAIYRHSDEIDFGQAIANCILNDIEDQILGRFGRQSARVNRKLNIRLQTGPAL